MSSSPINLFEAGRAAAESGASESTQPPEVLVQLKAGRAFVDGTTVTSSPTKGRLSLRMDPAEQILHVVWEPRSTTTSATASSAAVPAATNVDLVVFPGDAQLSGPLPECTTGKMFVLRLAGSGRKLLFWSQEPEPAAQLDDTIATFNELLADAAAASAAYNDRTASAASAAAGSDPRAALLQRLAAQMGVSPDVMQQSGMLQSLLGGAGGSGGSGAGGAGGSGAGGAAAMDPEEAMLQQALEESRREAEERAAAAAASAAATEPATTTATAAATTPTTAADDGAGDAVTADMFAAALSNVLGSAGAGSAGAGSTSTSGAGDVVTEAQREAFLRSMMGPPMDEIITADGVLGVLDDADLDALAEYMPEDQGGALQSRHEVRTFLHSPFMRQALARVAAAVSQGEAASMLIQFGIHPSAALGVSAESFLRAIQDHIDNNSA